MPSVDLRSAYDQVYDQGWEGSCGPHAITAALDVMFERATGKPHRFDKQHLWHWCKLYQGRFTHENIGITFDGAEQTLRIKGAVLTDSTEAITGFKLVRSWFADQQFAELKRRLCMGIPTLWAMRVGSGFDRRNDGKPWRTHTWGNALDGEYTHLVCIVGYDDVAQRWCVENSWGPGFGDGGWFGVPYSQFAVMSEDWWHIDMAPILWKPVQGFEMTVPVMLTGDKSAFVDRASSQLKEHLMATLASGVPGLIAECKAWGVSDKHLEALAGWQRGSVRAFKAEHPDLAWDGFVWDQI